MQDPRNNQEQEAFWTLRYAENRTGWDIGYPSPPITTYFDQVENKAADILIPGAGNAYEAEYLFQQGFQHVRVLDIAQPPLQALQERIPSYPKEYLTQGNFFTHEGQYDYIIEQTFFCSFVPLAENRHQYAQTMHKLLKPGGKLIGLWFDIPLTGSMEKRPFGGTLTEYRTYFEPLFEIQIFERAYNSIKPRQGNELFGLMVKKEGIS